MSQGFLQDDTVKIEAVELHWGWGKRVIDRKIPKDGKSKKTKKEKERLVEGTPPY